MIRFSLFLIAVASSSTAQSPVPISAPPVQSPATPKPLPSPGIAAGHPTPHPIPASPMPVPPESLLAVRRIYVSQLTGGVSADALRELIIASLNGTKLFVLTEDPERADAVLKGAAEDRAYIDTFDSDKSLSDRSNIGGYTANGSKTGKLGAYGGMSVDDRDSHHIRERKHEAYAAVRLCSSNGDILWSTSQESSGTKFRGAGADVALKIARQLLADYEVTRTLSPR